MQDIQYLHLYQVFYEFWNFNHVYNIIKHSRSDFNFRMKIKNFINLNHVGSKLVKIVRERERGKCMAFKALHFYQVLKVGAEWHFHGQFPWVSAMGVMWTIIVFSPTWPPSPNTMCYHSHKERNFKKFQT